MATAVRNGSVSRQLAAEVMETCLSDHERNLLRMAARGGTSRILSLYRSQYKSEDEVEAALDAIKAKVERALRRRGDRLRDSGDEPLIEESVGAPLSAGDEAAEDATGVRVRSGGGGSMAGAGAALPSPNGNGTPPELAAPAPSALRPSGDALDTDPVTPATRPTVQRPVRVPTERERSIMAVLRSRRCSAKALGAELALGKQVLTSALAKAEQKGLIERTPQNAYDWPGAVVGKARPSRVWRLVDEPEGVEMVDRAVLANDSPVGSRSPSPSVPDRCRHGKEPAGSCWTCNPPPTHKPAPKAASMINCEHGAPRRLCRVCTPQKKDVGEGDGGERFPLVDTPVGYDAYPVDVREFDAEKFWRGLSAEQKQAVLLVAVGELAAMAWPSQGVGGFVTG